MIPLYKYNYKFAAKSKWPENVENVLNALRAEKHSTEITDFHFEVTEHGKSIAFDRLLKLDNSFEEFRIGKYTISSLLSDKAISTDTQKSLLSVLMKVGRSIPFYKSIFFIEQHNWNQKPQEIEVSGSDIFNAEIPKNGIILSNDWWISGRQQHLSLMTLPVVVEKSLLISEAVEPVALRIGKVINRDMIFLAEKGENSVKSFLSENDDNILAQEFKGIASRLVEQGKIELKIGNDPDERVTGFSRKRIISSVLKDLKFRPINAKSAKGLLLYSRRTERNNFISLYFDFGSWSSQCNVALRIQGPLWFYSLPFSYVDGRGEVSTPEAFEKSILNMKNILMHSHELIEKIEKNHGKSPKWYQLYS